MRWLCSSVLVLVVSAATGAASAQAPAAAAAHAEDVATRHTEDDVRLGLTAGTALAYGNARNIAGRSYTYDFEDRIRTADGGAVRIVYDGDGNLAAKTVGGVTTRYLVDELNPTGYSQVLEEIVNGEVQKQYTYGHTIISQRQKIDGVWSTSFYSLDAQGSVRQLTNTDGVVTDTYEYDAFGIPGRLEIRERRLPTGSYV